MNHELSARRVPIDASPETDNDLTVAVYDDDGVRLFAEGPGGFHIPREKAHLDAAETALKRALASVAKFKE